MPSNWISNPSVSRGLPWASLTLFGTSKLLRRPVIVGLCADTISGAANRVRHKAIPTTARRRKDDKRLRSVIDTSDLRTIYENFEKVAGTYWGLYFAYRVAASATAATSVRSCSLWQWR